MSKIKDFLNGKKTYILAALGIGAAVMGWAGEELTMIQLLQAVGAALGLSFLRMGVKKSAPK